MSTISANLADVMDQSKIDIGKTIDTKLSENITTLCDTKVWIKTIFMENIHGWPAEAMHRDIICILIAMLATTKTNMPCYKSDGMNGLASRLYVGQRKTMPWYQIRWAAEPIHRENVPSAQLPQMKMTSRGNVPNFSLTPIWPGYPQLGCYLYHQPIVLGSLWWRLWSIAIS